MPGYLKNLLTLTGLPIIAFVTGISLFRQVLPHWSGPGFLTLSFICAAFLDVRFEKNPRCAFSFITKSSLVFMIILTAASVGIIEWYPGTIGSNGTANHGDGDFTLDMEGWKQFGKDFTAWQTDAVKKKQIAPGLSIVCNKWFPASHIEYYVARASKNDVVGVGNLNDLHQFVWLNHYQDKLAIGQDALCIIPSNYPEDVQQTYGAYFAGESPIHIFTATRGKKVARYFYVYLLKGYKGNDEARTYKVM
jgi:hypothetical protein